MGTFALWCDDPDRLAFCDNDTNRRRLQGSVDAGGFFKDGLNEFIVRGAEDAIIPTETGTKVGAIWRRSLPAQAEVEFRVRLFRPGVIEPFRMFDDVFALRQREADEFYDSVHGDIVDEDMRRVQRQALAGMLWSKQFYYFDVRQWLEGDPSQPEPPRERRRGRNWE